MTNQEIGKRSHGKFIDVFLINHDVEFKPKRLVGIIDTELKLYTTHRETDKHFYIKGRGYPIESIILKYLKSMEVETIQIIEQGKTIRRYKTPLQKYLNAVAIQHNAWGDQRCVPLIEMIEVT